MPNSCSWYCLRLVANRGPWGHRPSRCEIRHVRALLVGGQFPHADSFLEQDAASSARSPPPPLSPPPPRSCGRPPPWPPWPQGRRRQCASRSPGQEDERRAGTRRWSRGLRLVRLSARKRRHRGQSRTRFERSPRRARVVRWRWPACRWLYILVIWFAFFLFIYLPRGAIG